MFFVEIIFLVLKKFLIEKRFLVQKNNVTWFRWLDIGKICPQLIIIGRILISILFDLHIFNHILRLEEIKTLGLLSI